MRLCTFCTISSKFRKPMTYCTNVILYKFTNVRTSVFCRYVWNGGKRCLCLTAAHLSAVYALLSGCLSSSTLGCCKSPHKLFIRLNLGTLLLLAFELVNSDGGGEKEKKRREAADRKKDQRSKSATLWSAGPTVRTSACGAGGQHLCWKRAIQLISNSRLLFCFLFFFLLLSSFPVRWLM